MPRPKKKRTEDYQSLKKVWYKKLEKSGFQDIEQDEFNLKQYSFRITQAAVRRSWHASSEYYYMADQFLHNFKFKNNLERIIWEYHANGISMRDIAKLLKKVKFHKKIHYLDIYYTIKRLTHEMKKMYLVGYND